MTRLARPAKCGALAASGLPLLGASAALRRLGKSPKSGRAPRPVGILRRIVRDAAARRLFVAVLLGALAGSYVALV